ncbi:MAG: GntR family transcriptional regulator [Betaproteobacteria bacterium]|nr:MAG: GntR family transcriptional regulator [Betaproteobacteria bacterium]
MNHVSTNPISLQQSIESKSEQAYRMLEEMIVTMDLQPGALLSESRLVEMLGLGRTPIREALQRLATEGLVEIMARRGIRVTDINIRQQLRLLEVRRALEQLNIRLSARRANHTIKEQFARIADGMSAAARDNDYKSFLHLDRDLNELIAVAADNEYSAQMLQKIHGLSRRFWHKHYLQVDDLAEVAGLHAAIAQAIADGDEEAAAAASVAHMDYIQSFTLSTLDL